MTVRAVVDRFEGNVAVLENLATGDPLDVPRDRLPSGTRAGDHLDLSAWRADASMTALPEETRRARERVRARQAALRARRPRPED